MATSIPASVFTNADVRLCVWFNDGITGLQQLSPDQRLAAAGYALMAANVPDGLITSNKLAAGAVGNVQLASNAVQSANIAAGAVESAHLTSNLTISGTLQASNFVGNGSSLNGVAPAFGSSNYVAKTGDSMTGPLNLSLNGLTVGGNQLVVSGGNVGIGTASPDALLTTYCGVLGANSGDSIRMANMHFTSNNNDQFLIEARRNSTVSTPGWDSADLFLRRFVDTTPISYARFGLWSLSFGTRTTNDHMTILDNGNVGIGTSTPQAKLDVNGTTQTKVLSITGGADVAEPFAMSGRDIPKGSVVVIDDEHPGQLKLSERAYDKRVAGIVSGAGGVNPGLTLSQHGMLEGGQNVALTGRVYALADATNGPIQPGDLLTTSSIPGHAMKVTDPSQAQGAILGKAMSRLESGRGLVLVLVTLQ
jgi:hypothetical protein